METFLGLDTDAEDRAGQRLARARKRVTDDYRDRARKARRYRGRGRSDESLPSWLQESALQPRRAQVRDLATAHSRAVRGDRVNGQSAKALKPVAWTQLTPGTIADAWVPYQDGTDYKRRPVAVGRVDRHGDVHVYPITTSMRRFNRIDKLIEIADWRGAGLKRACGVVSREVVLPRTDIISRIGTLQGTDADQFDEWMRRNKAIHTAHKVAATLPARSSALAA